MRSAPATSRTRIVFLGAIAFLWLGLLFGRLVELQVFRHADLSRRAQRQQQRTLEVTPKRGVIYDRNGHELAVSIAVDSVFAIPSEVSNPLTAARRLSPILGVGMTALEDRLRSDRSFVWLKRKLDAAQTERARALDLEGVYFQREYKRFYPKRQLAAHVLGFVGIDEDGLAGIEYALDDVIRGRPRRLVITADGRRRTFERHNQVPSEGASIALALDENIQYLAEQELAAALARTRARQGTIIVQDTRSGEILALANQPTFNPNEPTAVPASRHLNPAVSLAFEPGSTFKVVTVAAALAEGLASPTEVINCQQGSIELAGHLIRDHKSFGWLTLRQVIQESSDVGAIKIGLRLGNRKMYQHIRRWNFGTPTGIELPAESRGLLRPARRWSRISIGAISMGQEVAITSLQLAAAISAIGNDGVWVQPRVVREIIRGNELEETTPPRNKRIIAKGVAEELQRMLAGVVTQGTGQAARPAGYTAAGKTGTAQKIDHTGTYSPTDFVASFAGYAPANDPVLTVLVVLDTPRGELYHGGEVAAPVFATVVERALAYLNVPRSRPVPQERSGPKLDRARVQDFRPGQFDPAPWRQPSSAPDPGTVEVREVRRPGPGGTPVELPAAGRRQTAGTVVLANDDTVAAPDLTGLSLRAVAEKCSQLGLEPVLAGSGVVAAQRPAPGTRLPRGSRVWVELRPSLPGAPARTM